MKIEDVPSIKDKGRIGSGNWDAFPSGKIPDIYQAAQEWSEQLEGIRRPWLCWCLSRSWSLLQQRLVLHAGWTPVVGSDTFIKDPPIADGSVYLDFNRGLRLPRFHRCFPLEWIFLFTERMAFWHSDMMLSKSEMKRAADCFENLEQGEMAMNWNRNSFLLRAMNRLRPVGNNNRLFEVIGCTTREASRQQYEEGLGFWRHPQKHPNNKDLPDSFSNWEHSVGVSLWARKHMDRVKSIGVNTKRGHANSWKIDKKVRSGKSKQELLESVEDIREHARRLGIEDLLP